MTGFASTPTDRLPVAVRAVRLIALVGGVIAVLGISLGLVSGAMPGAFYVEAIKNVFWIDNDLNVWAWYSTIVLALLAVAFAIGAAVRRAAGLPSRADVVFAIVAAYLSVDEGAALHERLGSLGERLGATWTYAWVAVGLPIAVVVGIVLLWVARRLDRVTLLRLVIAGAIYLAGALGIETIGGALYTSAGVEWTSATYILVAGLEEVLEATGVLIALWAALSRIRIDQVDGVLRVTPHEPERRVASR